MLFNSNASQTDMGHSRVGSLKVDRTKKQVGCENVPERQQVLSQRHERAVSVLRKQQFQLLSVKRILRSLYGLHVQLQQQQKIKKINKKINKIKHIDPSRVKYALYKFPNVFIYFLQ
jgi:hypothetical protein